MALFFEMLWKFPGAVEISINPQSHRMQTVKQYLSQYFLFNDLTGSIVKQDILDKMHFMNHMIFIRCYPLRDLGADDLHPGPDSRLWTQTYVPILHFDMEVALKEAAGVMENYYTPPDWPPDQCPHDH